MFLVRSYLMFLPAFGKYFVRQWEPIIPMISPTTKKFVQNQKSFKNNLEAGFSKPYHGK